MTRVHEADVMEALEVLVADGRLAPDQAAAVREQSHQVHADHERAARRGLLTQFFGYVGGGLVVLGLVILGSSSWSGLTEAARVALPTVAGIALLALASWLALSTRPGGRASLVRREHTPRRILVGFLAAVSAALLAISTLMLAVGPGGFEQQGPPTGAFLAACCVGFAVSAYAAWLAHGPAPTVAVIGFSFGLPISLLAVLGVLDGPLAGGLVMAGVGALLALAGARWLTPAWLTQAVGMAAWVLGGNTLAESIPDVTSYPWLGRAVLLAAIIVGVWLFSRGSGWPFAAAAALGSALLVLTVASTALGAGVALVLSGFALVLVSLCLFWVGRRRSATHGSTAGAVTGPG